MSNITTEIWDAADNKRPLVEGQEDAEINRLKQLRTRHWTMLGSALAIIVLAFLLQEVGGGRVAFFGSSNLTLPETCGSRIWFGIECPGCGLTRSFIALASGNIQSSLRSHRLGWLLATAVVLQIPYRAYALWDLRKNGTRQRNWPRWVGTFLIAALLINWLIVKVIALISAN